ncbi:NAD-dependent epimerase/dehydratase family protein, partial [Acinetobacter baumannii]
MAGIKLLEAMYKQYRFNSISLMQCNLYGPNDSFDLKHSHVLSALVKKFSDAKSNND